MIVSTVLGALARYYAGELAAAGRPVGDAYRYWGVADDDCCSPDESGRPAGTLTVRVVNAGTSEFPPGIAAVMGACVTKPIVEIKVRLLRCWPVELDTAAAERDAEVAGLADDLWILGASTQALLGGAKALDLSTDDSRRVGCDLGGWTCEPVEPQGGCAGVELTVYAALVGPYTAPSAG